MIILIQRLNLKATLARCLSVLVHVLRRCDQYQTKKRELYHSEIMHCTNITLIILPRLYEEIVIRLYTDGSAYVSSILPYLNFSKHFQLYPSYIWYRGYVCSYVLHVDVWSKLKT